MSSQSIVDVTPNVSRITEGLRDTGYDLNSALADIVDNSVAAGATEVNVELRLDFAGEPRVEIVDNGQGMDRLALINAMRYGSDAREDPSSLGKFGLGLKTASTAFCRELVVVTRADTNEAPIRAIWDLDYLAANQRWSLQLGTATPTEVSSLDAVAKRGPGTAVLWQKADRVLEKYQDGDTKKLKRALERSQKSLRAHLGMVFQRFLDLEDARARTVNIRVNGEPVEPWNPFGAAVEGLPVLEECPTVRLPDGSSSQFLIKAYILPRKEEISDKDKLKEAKITNANQGIYVYRENRLIHGPDWLDMFTIEPHFNLLRVDLSFDHSLDEAFQVDIKKSKISLNPELHDWIREKFLAGPRREAEQRYRKGSARSASSREQDIHTSSNTAINQKAEGLKTASILEGPDQNGKVQISNNAGSTWARISVQNTESNTIRRIVTVPTLDNGVLWDFSLSNGSHSVTLNTSHPFYQKAYLPNAQTSPVIQAIDFFLWSLAQAELNNIAGEESAGLLEEFRIEVSRNLRKLVADLPDPVGES